MFDIGWPELFIIGLLTLIVVGPKDLPRVLKTVTGMIRKVKSMAREFQNGIDEVVREAELADVRKQVEDQANSLGIADDMGLEELNEIKSLSEDQLSFTKDQEAKAKKSVETAKDDELDLMPETDPAPKKEA